MLEGGYDLEPLERSSEAVVRTLLVNPKDTEGFDKLLEVTTFFHFLENKSE